MAEHSRLSVLHLITSLEVGGAETMLANLLKSMDVSLFNQRVITLKTKAPDPIANIIEKQGIKVDSLNIDHIKTLPSCVFKLIRILTREQPHILQTWLYHADLIGTLAHFRYNQCVLAWNVRCADLDLRHYGYGLRLARHLCRYLSHRPNVVIANAKAGRKAHEGLGYRPKRWVVIPNGFELDRFRPNSMQRARVRSEWGLEDKDFIIAMPGRWDPAKDHQNFLLAARMLEQATPNLRLVFLLMGKGISESSSELGQLISHVGRPERLMLLGSCHDMSTVYPAFDLVVLSSRSEAFPNILGEAMATALPCIATNVGDVKAIMGQAGKVVPPQDPSLLAEAMGEIISMSTAQREDLGQAARRRIAERYALSDVVQSYENLYHDLAAKQGSLR